MGGWRTGPLAVALLLATTAACSSATAPCDGPPYLRCTGGMIYMGGCGAADRLVGQCAQGCLTDGALADGNGCPAAMCRESVPKTEGDPCQAAADCLPTLATWSATAVENPHLACDVGSHTCVAADPPVVAGWLQACSADLIGPMMDGQTYGFDTAVPDPGCGEGWCAVYREVGATCVANACTRPCTGDHQCPAGATCVGVIPGGCIRAVRAYCKPGGPASVGFTCR